MPVTEAHKRASKKRDDSQDNLTLRPDKTEGQQIRQAAAEAGQSVQAFVLSCCREYMKRG